MIGKRFPNISQPMVDENGNITQEWYAFLAGIGKPQAVQSVAVGASPFIYQALQDGQLLINGGTVSAIQFSRDGTTYYTAPSSFVLSRNDRIKITYTLAPTIEFVPR